MSIDHPTAAQCGALQALWAEAFGDDDRFIQMFFSTAFSPGRCRCVTVSGQTTAALYWFDCETASEKIAYLYAVATASAHRGRGLCRKLMEDTHALLKEQGYAGAVLVPGEAGLFQMYAKMGYATISCMDHFSCAAAGMAEVHRAAPEEYAAARRALLPKGGIIQEGENLPYLASCAELYTGDDFCLAAVRDGERLRGMELLGNTAAAPGILAALGLKSGTFRIPGRNPFAMYHALSDAPMPTYFGLAFD